DDEDPADDKSSDDDEFSDDDESSDDEDSREDEDSADYEDENCWRREEVSADAALEHLGMLLVFVLIVSRPEPVIKTVFLICISFLLPLSWYLDYRRITCTLQENDEEPGTDEHSRRRE